MEPTTAKVERGKFIVFEGLDGSGKTTQLAMLKSKLSQYDIRCKDEREPSDSILGLIARGTIKKKISLKPESMALLFAADRFEHITNEVLPMLTQGVHVLCDRFVYSNVAYQGMQVPMDFIIQNNQMTIDQLMPDLTLFVDVDPGECRKRMGLDRIGIELYDDRGEAARENFFKAFELLKDKSKVAVIDGNYNAARVFDQIWEVVKPLLVRENGFKQI